MNNINLDTNVTNPKLHGDRSRKRGRGRNPATIELGTNSEIKEQRGELLDISLHAIASATSPKTMRLHGIELFPKVKKPSN